MSGLTLVRLGDLRARERGRQRVSRRLEPPEPGHRKDGAFEPRYGPRPGRRRTARQPPDAIGQVMCRQAIGSVTEKVEPVPGPAESARTCASMALASARAIARPMPEPPSALDREGSTR